MAKRRRLVMTPEPIQRLNPELPESPARAAALGTPPIAAVAGDSAAAAALAEVTREVDSARTEGRLAQRVPIDAIDEHHLVRDRLAVEGDAFDSLIASLRARGQQTPIEVVGLKQGRYGLISGLRRLLALRYLHGETGEARFATALVILRSPQDAPEAYVAMVEENEIRSGLSYYERARIASRAVKHGVFFTEKQALNGLFGSVSRAKRSKIKSFIPIVEALDDVLRFPTRIGERLGLALSARLAADPGEGPRLAALLRQADPGSARAELALLARPAAVTVADAGSGPAVRLAYRAGRVTLSGTGVTAEFASELRGWLAGRAGES